MKYSLIFFLISGLLFFSNTANAQRNRNHPKPAPKIVVKEGNPAIIVDRRLSVLRDSPSLYAMPVQRLSVGREVTVINEKQGDGVLFYQVRLSEKTTGWIQTEAVVGSFRKDDDQRLAKLIQASDNFDKIDKAAIFIKQFPKSPLRPAVLLLVGDLMEEEAIELSKKAAKSFDRREMAASGAPLHSFYLNFSSLDRYRKLGIKFLFNIYTKNYHYNGDSWLEILRKFPNTPEAEEAGKRLETLKEKMDKR